MTPLISLIIPVYNVEQYLRQCLDSVLSQTYTNIEIILINDGSTDNSGIICEEYKKTDNRIVIIQKTNGGLSETRNRGLDVCKGKYITFIDSDDVIHAEYVNLLYNNIRNGDICFCKYKKFTTNFSQLAKNDFKTFEFSGEEMNHLLYNSKFADLAVISCCKLYKREIWDGLRFPLGKLHEDVHMAHFIYARAEKISFIDVELYYYRMRAGSITSTFSKKSVDDTIDALQIRALYFKDRKNYSLYKKANTSKVAILLRKSVDRNVVEWNNYSIIKILKDDVEFKIKLQLLLKKVLPLFYNSYRNFRNLS